MISKRVRGALFLTAGCALCAAATPAPQTQPAQTPARVAADVPPAAVTPEAVPPAAIPPAPPPPPPQTPQTLRDPTQIDPALSQALTAQGGAPAVQNVVVLITRHGLITMAGKPTVALVEVQGAGSYFVQKGSRLTTSVSGVQATITVDALSADNFQVSVDAKNVSIAIR